VLSVLVAFVALSTSDLPRALDTATGSAPDRLTAEEFWRLASGFSEPDGTFHSENLVSNEIRFQTILPALAEAVAPGRAYVGVGSEQNFTYIATARPAMAFIVDIRRGNFALHLAYKALFELSADRAEFVSRLFSRPRPPGLGVTSTAAEMFDAYDAVPPSRDLFDENLRAIDRHLTRTRALPLTALDRQAIGYVYRAWFDHGTRISYALNGGRGGFGRFPTYADLMTATDDSGVARSYLATEAAFRFLKELQARNLVVPVIGNFGGPKALRAVAAYLKQQRMTVSAFYVSNVEQYLERDGLWEAFCANAATMPTDARSVLIRSWRGGFSGRQRASAGGFSLELAPVRQEVQACAGT
jgi:hypothetical protein